MNYLKAFIVVGLLYAATASTDTNDAVNERLPLDLNELEQSWGLDCLDVARRTQAWLLKHKKGCNFSPDLLRDTRKCGFIYQPPGGEVRRAQPDYVQMLAQINAVTESGVYRNCNDAAGG